MNVEEAEKFYDNIDRHEECLEYINEVVEADKVISESVSGSREDHEAHPQMLAALLMAEVIHLNNHHWKKDWPDDARKRTSLNVTCNDIFVWGSSDGEELEYSEIEDLYDHWVKDQDWGPAIWCIKKRRMPPQAPVARAIMTTEIWDLDAITAEFRKPAVGTGGCQ